MPGRAARALTSWALVAAVCSAASADFPVPPKWSAVLTRSGTIETKHGHIQGICVAQDAVYMTLVNGLYKFDWQGRLLKRINLNPHVGDICLWKDRLYLVTCGGGKGTIEVFDCNLSHIKGAATVRSADGIACLDGVLYVGLGPVNDKMRPYRGNWFGKFDAETLQPLCEPFIVDHGEMTWLGVQNIATDGRDIYVNFYTPVDKQLNFFRFDRDFHVKGGWYLGCGHGFDIVGGARPGAVRFVHSCTIGIFDQAGDDPMPPQTLLRYAELTPGGRIEDVTKYEGYVYNQTYANTHIVDLRVCGEQSPTDVVKPVFSWRLKTDRAGAAQKAYAIMLRTAAGEDVWQTGTVNSGESQSVAYSGPDLKPGTKYEWRVIVTDERGRQIFAKPATFQCK